MTTIERKTIDSTMTSHAKRRIRDAWALYTSLPYNSSRNIKIWWDDSECKHIVQECISQSDTLIPRAKLHFICQLDAPRWYEGDAKPKHEKLGDVMLQVVKIMGELLEGLR
jgi:hypothetical protein